MTASLHVPAKGCGSTPPAHEEYQLTTDKPMRISVKKPQYSPLHKNPRCVQAHSTTLKVTRVVSGDDRHEKKNMTCQISQGVIDKGCAFSPLILVTVNNLSTVSFMFLFQSATVHVFVKGHGPCCYQAANCDVTRGIRHAGF